MFGFFEKRKHVRFDVDIAVDIEISKDDFPLHTHIRQVSVEGLVLVSEKTVDVGRPLHIAFELPRSADFPRGQHIEIEGKVIHAKRRDERFFEIGVNIESIGPAYQEAFAKYLASLAKSR